MDVTIRPAQAGDTDRLVAIVHGEPRQELLGLVPDPMKARAIGALLVRNGLELDLGLTAVAVVGGHVVGLVELRRPGQDPRPTWRTSLRQVIAEVMIVGPGGLWRYVRYQRARPRVNLSRPAGALYIGEVDVHPDLRNRGIGGSLLRYAEEVARSEGCATLALTTSILNPAQRLYQRHGFQIIDTRLDAGYERLTGIPGRVLMTKQLC